MCSHTADKLESKKPQRRKNKTNKFSAGPKSFSNIAYFFPVVTLYLFPPPPPLLLSLQRHVGVYADMVAGWIQPFMLVSILSVWYLFVEYEPSATHFAHFVGYFLCSGLHRCVMFSDCHQSSCCASTNFLFDILSRFCYTSAEEVGFITKCIQCCCFFHHFSFCFCLFFAMRLCVWVLSLATYVFRPNTAHL